MRWCIVHEPYAPSYEPQKKKGEAKKRGGIYNKTKKANTIKNRSRVGASTRDKTSQVGEG
jgi:hypothetical protein